MKFGEINTNSDLENVIQFSKQYVALADTTITNNTSETSMLSGSFAGAGKSITSTLNTGSVIRLRFGGTITTPLVVPGSLTIKLKMNNTVVGTVVFNSLLGNMVGNFFNGNCALIVRATGTSGQVSPIGAIEIIDNNLTLLQTGTITETASPVTVNTTAPIAIDLTATWQVASTSRSLKITGATINIES